MNLPPKAEAKNMRSFLRPRHQICSSFLMTFPVLSRPIRKKRNAINPALILGNECPKKKAAAPIGAAAANATEDTPVC
jgi:hypothetical protein